MSETSETKFSDKTEAMIAKTAAMGERLKSQCNAALAPPACGVLTEDFNEVLDTIDFQMEWLLKLGEHHLSTSSEKDAILSENVAKIKKVMAWTKTARSTQQGETVTLRREVVEELVQDAKNLRSWNEGALILSERSKKRPTIIAEAEAALAATPKGENHGS